MANTEAQPVNTREIAADDLPSHLRLVVAALKCSRQRSALIWLGAGLVVIVAATAYGQIRLNAWNEPFYDALARKDLSGVRDQLIVFAIIAGALLVLNVSQTWLANMTKLKLREALTRDLFFQWLTPHRSFRIAAMGEIGVNPDQRIHADAQRLAEVSTDLGVGLLQATLLLVSFIGVLWALSAGVTFDIAGTRIAIPGYMEWSALLYASIASFGSWRVGRPLVELGAERYGRESELRFALMRVNEHVEAIAVCRGEDVEESRLHREFDRLLTVLRRLVTATTNLAWVTAGYGWFTIVAPIIVASPAYFAGNLTFGGLLMAVGAFTQVQQSLRWFVDNASVIADWRAGQKSYETRPPEELDVAVDADDSAECYDRARRRERVERALAALPAHYRSAVVLKTRHGLSYGEIAGHLGISERMVKRYIVKAYARLRDGLSAS